MEMGLLEALLEYGSMGLFAAFLVWQHLSMQKRFDALVERFQKQLEGFQDKAEAGENKLRDRYDAVITQYQDEKHNFNMEKLRKLDDIDKHIDGLPFQAILIQMEALSMAQRDLQTTVDKGMEIMKAMQEDARIKEMARKMQKGDV